MPKPRSIYLIGPPGVGKSTVMRKLLLDWRPLESVRLHRTLAGHPLINYEGKITGVHLGYLGGLHPGTDSLPKGVYPDALAWAARLQDQPQMIFAEGSRLGSPTFMIELARTTRLTVIHLTATPEVTAHRRDLRDRKQNPGWITGRTTDVAYTIAHCERAGLPVIKIDTDQPLDHTADSVRAVIEGIPPRPVQPLTIANRS